MTREGQRFGITHFGTYQSPTSEYLTWLHRNGVQTGLNSQYGASMGSGYFLQGMLGLMTGGAGDASAATGANNGISLSLRYKAGWSPEQIAAADSKVANLNAAAQQGELVVSQVQRSGTSAASMFRSAGGDLRAESAEDTTAA